MTKTKLSVLLLMLFSIALMFGCSDEFSNDMEETPQVDPNDPVVQNMLDAGFAIEDIEAYEDYYVAEGDIIFYKEEPIFADDTPDNGRTEQARSTYTVAPAHRNINIYLNQGSFSSLNLNDAVNTSIAAFNAVELRFSLHVFTLNPQPILLLREIITSEHQSAAGPVFRFLTGALLTM